MSDMEIVYILTGLSTIAGAIVGLVITCRLERRALNARRQRRHAPDTEGMTPAA